MSRPDAGGHEGGKHLAQPPLSFPGRRSLHTTYPSLLLASENLFG